MTKMTFSPPMRKVSSMWRTSCCALLRIPRAVRSCKFSSTKKSSDMSLRLGCDLSPSGLSGGLSLELSSLHSAASSLTMKPSGLRRQYEVVSFGFSLDLWSVSAHCCLVFCRSSHHGWAAAVWRGL